MDFECLIPNILQTDLSRDKVTAKMGHPIRDSSLGGRSSDEGVGRVLLYMDGLLWAAFAGYKNPDALDHFGGRTASLWEEDVGMGCTIERSDGTGDNHCRQRGVKLFGPADEFVAVHLGHQQVTEQEIERAGE